MGKRGAVLLTQILLPRIARQGAVCLTSLRASARTTRTPGGGVYNRSSEIMTTGRIKREVLLLVHYYYSYYYYSYYCSNYYYYYYFAPGGRGGRAQLPRRHHGGQDRAHDPPEADRLSIYRSIDLSIYISIYLSIYLSI